jgi:hypothetical protein
VNKPRKPDLKPAKLTDAQLDALAGVDGFTVEQVMAAQAWGTPPIRALLAARDEDGDT